MVEVTVQLPDDIATQVAAVPGERARRLLEALALECYRSGKFSRAQVRNLLGLSWQATEEFLAQHDAYRHYSMEDLEADRHTLQAILPS